MKGILQYLEYLSVHKQWVRMLQCKSDRFSTIKQSIEHGYITRVCDHVLDVDEVHTPNETLFVEVHEGLDQVCRYLVSWYKMPIVKDVLVHNALVGWDVPKVEFHYFGVGQVFVDGIWHLGHWLIYEIFIIWLVGI